MIDERRKTGKEEGVKEVKLREGLGKRVYKREKSGVG